MAFIRNRTYFEILAVLLLVGLGIYFTFSHSHTSTSKDSYNAVPEAATTTSPRALSNDLYPLYLGAVWGPAEATTTSDYGTVLVLQSEPFLDTTNIASLSIPFTQYYHDKLLAAGWEQDMSREAGGPGAEVSVYTNGTAFIVVSFHSVFHVQQPDAPSQCPCDVQFTLMNGLKP